MIFLGWVLGIICFAAVVGLILFPILTIVHGVKESKKPFIEGQKKYSKTMLYVILTVVSFFALIAGLVGWSVLSYAFSVIPQVM